MGEIQKFVEWIAKEHPYLSGDLLADMAELALKNDPSWVELTNDLNID